MRWSTCGQRGLHAARERLVAGVGGERVEPHDTVGAAAQARHLFAELRGVAAVPAVGQDHHHRAAADAAAVDAVELGERLADAGAARPVGDRLGGAAERAVGVAAGELAGHARQPRAEHERLDAGARRHACLQVHQQHPRVGRHGAGNIAHQDEPARPPRGGAVAALDELAAVAQREADRGAQVVDLAAPPGRHRAAGDALRRAPGESGQQSPGGRTLGVGVQREVALVQQLLLAPRGGHGLDGDFGLRLGYLGGDPEPRQRRALDRPELLERVVALLVGRGEGERERLGEHRHVGVRRAQRRPQRIERLLALRGVDRGERPVRREQVPHPHVDPGAPHHRRQVGDGRMDGELRHPAALPRRARGRCPPAP